jgi:hypothetical protein
MFYREIAPQWIPVMSTAWCRPPSPDAGRNEEATNYRRELVKFATRKFHLNSYSWSHLRAINLVALMWAVMKKRELSARTCDKLRGSCHYFHIARERDKSTRGGEVMRVAWR